MTGDTRSGERTADNAARELERAAGDGPRQHHAGDAERNNAPTASGAGAQGRDARPSKPVHRPVPGVKHVPEPDAENIMPAEDEPGTL